jgi:hypothetical protein
MAVGREVCSDTTGTVKKPSVKALCQWIKTIEKVLSRSDGQGSLKVLYIR